MTDPTPSPEAIEAAAEALYVANRGPWVSGHGTTLGGTPWGTSHEREVRETYVNAATAALSAAYPALRAQIIRELAEDAFEESSRLNGEVCICPPKSIEPECPIITADATHRWLSARTETKGEVT
jgi:hypothetical protein